MSNPKSWLAQSSLNDLGKKLRERAEETLTNFVVETNVVERGGSAGAFDARAFDADASDDRHRARDARERELEELCASMSDEIRALKEALRREAARDDARERGDGDAVLEQMRKELQTVRDGKAWAEAEAREFERECEEATSARAEAEAEASEARRAADAMKRELEALRASVQVDNVTSPLTAPMPVESEIRVRIEVDESATREATAERDRALQQLKSMKGVNETLQKQLKEYANRVPTVERERDEARAQGVELAESLAQARAERETAEKLKAAAEATLTSAKREKESLEAEISALKRKEENSKQVQSDVEAAKQRVSEGALKKSLSAADTKLAAANEHIKTLEADVSSKRSEITTLTEANESLESELRRLREEVKSLTGAVSERNEAMTELAELRNELADARRSIEATALADSSAAHLEAERDKAEKEMLTMARRVAMLEKQLLELHRAQEDAATELEHKVDATKRDDDEEIERLKACREDLEAKLAAAERAVAKLTAEANESREALSSAQSVAAEASAARADLLSKIDAAEIRVMNANALAEASKTALEDFKKKSSETARAVQDALRAERDAAKTACEAAEVDRDAWREKCNEARDTLEKWREKARKLMAAKDAELEAARSGASPSRVKANLFDDDASATPTVAPTDTAAPAPASSSEVEEVHFAYLAEIIKRLFLVPYDDHDRADALVLVVCSLLRLTPEDEFRIKAFRASQRAKSSSKFLGGYFG